MPHAQAISLGPDMFEVHTPNEHLNISSTKRTWDYLVAILKGMNLEEGATAMERNRQIGGHRA